MIVRVVRAADVESLEEPETRDLYLRELSREKRTLGIEDSTARAP